MNRSPLYVPDLAESDIEIARPEILTGESIISYFSVPWIVKGRLMGLLEIFHRSRLEPDRDWIEFLETIARQAGTRNKSLNIFGSNRENTSILR